MKTYLFVIALLLSAAIYPVPSAQADYPEIIKDASLDASLGYRADELDWSIARTLSGGSPKIFSELTWKDLGVWQLNLNGQLELNNSYISNATTIVKTGLSYGQIVTGDNQDSDYAGDNRTLEWSRSNNDADDGNTFDVSGAVGLKFDLLESKFFITPLIGYAFNRQELSLTNGLQTVSDDANHDLILNSSIAPAPLGPIVGLNSRYDANWWGPWLGLDVELAFSPKLNFGAGLEYHWVDYYGRADWNLREDLAHPLSFEQEASGHGLVVDLSAEYDLDENWSLLLTGRFQNWQTDSGIDRTFFASGSRGITRLNEVNWESHALMAGLRYRF